MESGAQGYYQELSASFDRVVEGSQEHQVRHISLDGHCIRLEFSESGLENRLYAALAHLQATPRDDLALTIKVWESEKSTVDFPFPPFDMADYHADNDDRWGINLRSTDADAIKCFYSPWPNQYFCAFNPRERTAIWWRPNGHDIPYFEQGSPLLTVLEWWLASKNLILTHGGVVGTGLGGAMIVGRGGRGKSTSAISCLFDDAMYYVADDYFILAPGPQPRAINLFQTGKLDEKHLRNKFPQLLPLVVNKPRPQDDKCLFFPGQHFAQRLCRELPVKAAILPVVGDVEQATLVKSRPTDLMPGFVASTLYQSKSGGAETLQALTKTLGSLPCYKMQIGSDLESIPRCISAAIAMHAK